MRRFLFSIILLVLCSASVLGVVLTQDAYGNTQMMYNFSGNMVVGTNFSGLFGANVTSASLNVSGQQRNWTYPSSVVSVGSQQCSPASGRTGFLEGFVAASTHISRIGLDFAMDNGTFGQLQVQSCPEPSPLRLGLKNEYNNDSFMAYCNVTSYCGDTTPVWHYCDMSANVVFGRTYYVVVEKSYNTSANIFYVRRFLGSDFDGNFSCGNVPVSGFGVNAVSNTELKVDNIQALNNLSVFVGGQLVYQNLSVQNFLDVVDLNASRINFLINASGVFEANFSSGVGGSLNWSGVSIVFVPPNNTASIGFVNNTPWINTGYASSVFVKEFEVNNSGNHNASNCSFYSNGQLSSYMSQTSFFVGAGNVSARSNLSITGVPVGGYVENMNVRCVGSDGGTIVFSSIPSTLIFLIGSPGTVGGGGSPTYIIVNGNETIKVLSDRRTNYYSVFAVPGGKKSRQLLINGNISQPVTIELACTGAICNWVHLLNASVTLPANSLDDVVTGFSIEVPVDAEQGVYYFAIVAISGGQVGKLDGKLQVDKFFGTIFSFTDKLGSGVLFGVPLLILVVVSMFLLSWLFFVLLKSVVRQQQYAFLVAVGFALVITFVWVAFS